MSPEALIDAIIGCAKKIVELEQERDALMKQENAEPGNRSSDIQRCNAQISHYKAEIYGLLCEYSAGLRYQVTLAKRTRAFVENECTSMAVWLQSNYMETKDKPKCSLWDKYREDNPDYLM